MVRGQSADHRNDRKFIVVESFVNIGDVSVQHIELTFIFKNDDTVAFGMAFCFDHEDTIRDILTFREIIIWTICKVYRDDVFNALQFSGVQLFSVDIDLRVRERTKFIGVVVMSVCQQDLCHLLRRLQQLSSSSKLPLNIIIACY